MSGYLDPGKPYYEEIPGGRWYPQAHNPRAALIVFDSGFVTYYDGVGGIHHFDGRTDRRDAR